MRSPDSAACAVAESSAEIECARLLLQNDLADVNRRARAGDPSDPRFDPAWREACEDFIWSIINSPEYVWIP